MICLEVAVGNEKAAVYPPGESYEKGMGENKTYIYLLGSFFQFTGKLMPG
jgi:hypothetical protein